MNRAERIAAEAEQYEREMFYRERYPDPEVRKFAELVGDKLVCKTCWAVMVDPEKHAAWHQT